MLTTVSRRHGSSSKLGGNGAAAKAMLAQLTATSGGPVLAAWEHDNIQYLTADLGVSKSKIPKWSSSNFDTCYVLTFDSALKLLTFEVSAEDWHPHPGPPPPSPPPSPSPSPPSPGGWDCHSKHSFKNSMNLRSAVPAKHRGVVPFAPFAPRPGTLVSRVCARPQGTSNPTVGTSQVQVGCE